VNVQGETVGVIRPTTGDDRYGDAGLTYGTEPTHEVHHCAFDPGGSTWTPEGRNAFETTPTLYAPPGADIAKTDRIIVRGDTYTITGKPAVWTSPFDGQTKGVVVPLQEVTG